MTANNLAANDNYQHLVFYAHGGMNSPKASANRIKDMAPVFKKNGVYSYHWMYDTGIMEELKDIIFCRDKETKDRVGGIVDWWDKLLENEIQPKPENLNVIVSNGGVEGNPKSASKTHGGFDNDHHTMNTILASVLEHPPEHPFQPGYMNAFNK